MPVRPLATRTRAAALGLLALAVGAGTVTSAAPARPGERRTVLVRIPAGAGLMDVARTLGRYGLVRSPVYFAFLAWVRGDASRLEAGTYRLSPGMPPGDILRRLVRGETATVAVTVVPGMTVVEVAHVLAAHGLVGVAAFLRYAAHAAPPPGFAAAAGVRQPLEGYLYPDTYRIPVGSTPAEIVAPMLREFAAAFGPQERAAARAEGLTPAEAVTLASIVQREASDPHVRRLVAAVFLNRLRLGMPLGSDATVYYAADVAPGGRLTRADFALPSPYNTYLHTGLPPGPIDNPGGGALTAALHPARADYLYFFARPDGRYVFSRTYAQQVAAERAARGG
ncbi:MAG: endolytic transglycosylase MltG [Firmicutes bacterium]|nr:endolytic transglycosylase MltG [Bacillota bacterium]